MPSEPRGRNALHQVIPRVLEGRRLDSEDARILFDLDLLLLGRLADAVRARLHPDGLVTFIKDAIINYTNVCITDCAFCAFYRRPRHAEAYLMPQEEILERVRRTWEHGGTQVLIQGGNHPGLRIEYFEDLLRAIKALCPITVHSLSASEIDQIARVSRLSLEETIRRLHAAGLDSLPGGGAEILVDRVRQRISPRKISAFLGDPRPRPRRDGCQPRAPPHASGPCGQPHPWRR